MAGGTSALPNTPTTAGRFSGTVHAAQTVDDEITTVSHGFMPNIPRMYAYYIQPGRVLLAGLAATVIAMALQVILPPLMGVARADIGPTGLFGWFEELIVGMIVAYCYSAVLVGIGRQSTGGTGVAFGILVWCTMGAIIMPIAAQMRPDGDIGSTAGPHVMMVALLTRIVYGGVLGILYKHGERFPEPQS